MQSPDKGFSSTKSYEYSTNITHLFFNDPESESAQKFQDRNSDINEILFMQFLIQFISDIELHKKAIEYCLFFFIQISTCVCILLGKDLIFFSNAYHTS